MRIRMPARTMLDALMALLFLLLMADRHTGNAAHELMGLLLAGLALLHARLNARWYGALGGGFRTPHRAVLSLANLALLAAFIGTLASAIPISSTLFGFMGFHGSLSDRELHLFFAHWSLVLAGMHLGFYWKRLTGGTAMRGLAASYGRLFTICTIPLAAYGLRVLVVREWQFPLTMNSAFTMWNPEDTLGLLLLDCSAVLCLFAWPAHILSERMRTMDKSATGPERKPVRKKTIAAGNVIRQTITGSDR